MAAWGATGVIGAGWPGPPRRDARAAAVGRTRPPAASRGSDAGRWRSSASSSGSRSRPSRTSATGSPTATTASAQLGGLRRQGTRLRRDPRRRLPGVRARVRAGADRGRSSASRAACRSPGSPPSAVAPCWSRSWSRSACGRACRRRRRAAPRAGASARRSRYLLRAQNADGGFGAAPGQRSSAAVLAAGRRSGWPRPATTRRRLTRGRARADRLPALGRRLAVRRRLARAHDPGASAPPGCRPRSFGGHDLVAMLERAVSRATARSSDQVNLTSFAVLALRAAGVAPARADAGVAGRASRTPTAASASRPPAGRAMSTTPGRRSRRWPATAAPRPGGAGPGGHLPAPPAEPRRRLPFAAGTGLQRPVDRVGGAGAGRRRRRPGALHRDGARRRSAYLQGR